eukprot:TRINITY_DN2153_c0_g1_i1.p1 TRINITY_DN2153_c0_g1~~TRINITY_DN2153_c0_g1_i1.p1  ORF type:complete len:730 (-),score=234.80 TRINITY_DN2153_c0_g1_i1:54-2243(-)
MSEADPALTAEQESLITGAVSKFKESVSRRLTYENSPTKMADQKPLTPLNNYSMSSPLERTPSRDLGRTPSRDLSRTPSRDASTPTKKADVKAIIQQLQVTPTASSSQVVALLRYIKNLEEEKNMSDDFKKSLQETLGLQVQALQTEIELETEKRRQLETQLRMFMENPAAAAARSSPQTMRHADARSPPSSDASLKAESTIRALNQLVEEDRAALSQQGDVLRMAGKTGQIEANIRDQLKKIAEETLFLQPLREQRNEMEHSPRFRDNDPKYQGLLTSINNTEANVKRLTDQMESERKVLQAIRHAQRMHKGIALLQDCASLLNQLHSHQGAQTELLRLTQVNDDLNRENLSLKDFQNKMEARLNAMSKTIEALNQERDALSLKMGTDQQHSQNQLKETQQEKQQIALQLKSQQEQVDKASLRISHLQDDVDRKIAQIVQLETQQATQAQEMASLTHTLLQLQADKAALQDRVLALTGTEAEVQSMQSLVSELQTQLQDRSTAVALKEAEESALHQHLSEAQEALAALTAASQQKEAVMTSEHTSAMQALQSQVMDLTAQLDQSRAKLEEATSQGQNHLAEVAAQLQAANSQASQLQVELKQIQAQLSEVEAKKGEVTSELEAEKKALSELQGAHSEVEATLEATQSQLEKTKMEVQALQEDLHKMKEREASMEQAHGKEEADYKTHLAQLRGELEAKTRDFDELTVQKNKLQTLYNAMRDMLRGADL